MTVISQTIVSLVTGAVNIESVTDGKNVFELVVHVQRKSLRAPATPHTVPKVL